MSSALPAPRPFMSANQVTIMRMVLLPVPCAMLLYAPSRFHWLVVVLYTILGMTDWVDGRLVRKYGPTVLGGLLDPVADKVFMAAVIMPLATMEMAHPVVVVAILFREFLITGLRSAMSLTDAPVRTSVLGKLKTAVQMVGAGFVFLVHRMEVEDCLWLMGILSAGAAAVMVWRYVVTRRFNPLVFVPGALIMLALVVRATLDTDDAVQVHWGIILIFTWASALDYLSAARALLTHGARLQGMGRLLWATAAGVVLPLAMFTLPRGIPVWVVLITAELTSGAVDNLRCHVHDPPKVFIYPLRGMVLVAGAAVLWAAPDDGAPGSAGFWLGVGMAGIMAAWTALDFWAARRVIWGPDAAPAARSA